MIMFSSFRIAKIVSLVIILCINVQLFCPGPSYGPETAQQQVERCQKEVAAAQKDCELADERHKVATTRAIMAVFDNESLNQKLRESGLPKTKWGRRAFVKELHGNHKEVAKFDLWTENCVQAQLAKRETQFRLEQAEKRQALEYAHVKAQEDAKKIAQAYKKKAEEAKKKQEEAEQAKQVAQAVAKTQAMIYTTDATGRGVWRQRSGPRTRGDSLRSGWRVYEHIPHARQGGLRPRSSSPTSTNWSGTHSSAAEQDDARTETDGENERPDSD